MSATDNAFDDRPELKQQINSLLENSRQEDAPRIEKLLNDIASFIQEIKSGQLAGANGVEPTSKKRKLESDPLLESNGTSKPRGVTGVIGWLRGDWPNSQKLDDISFSSPQRKKLCLEIGSSWDEGIRAINPKDGKREFGIPFKEIEHIACLPAPERAQPTFSFCVIPRCNDGVTQTSPAYIFPMPDQIVWNIPAIANTLPDSPPSLQTIITQAFRKQRLMVLEPNPSDFTSQIAQAHRKGEKAYHVKAFRGSRDGFLYFLPTGLLFAFKKPLIFLSFSAIISISYTSVLQRTFNLSIRASTVPPHFPYTKDDVVHPAPSDEQQEFEFAMVDQADFDGIDKYVKKHGLNDESLAEARRAKIYGVNKNGKIPGREDGWKGDEEVSELVKAEREANGDGEMGEAPGAANEEDDSDEEDDENFDPGSEGESEGSGSNTEEEGEDGGGEGREFDDNGDDDDDEEVE